MVLLECKCYLSLNVTDVWILLNTGWYSRSCKWYWKLSTQQWTLPLLTLLWKAAQCSHCGCHWLTAFSLEEAAVAELVTVLCLILSVRRFGPTKHLKPLRQQTLQVKRCCSNLAEVRTQILLWEETTGEYNNCTWSQEKKLEKVSVILSPCKFEVHHGNNHDRLHIRRKIKINSKVNGLCFIHVYLAQTMIRQVNVKMSCVQFHATQFIILS